MATPPCEASGARTKAVGSRLIERMKQEGPGRPVAGAPLGTLGPGNHFIELCLDEEGRLWAMLHSGSMGARSFIVRGKGNAQSFHTCSHGAGRAMSRTEAKRRFTLDDHVRATEGVECRKDAEVIDETPMAYKDIDAVMAAQADLVEIARALASEPSFMLLDEPFAGIDPLAIADIREVISYLRGRGIGILITDHNVRETLDIIDRASIIHAGEVLFEGSPSEIVDNPEVRRVYLGERFG